MPGRLLRYTCMVPLMALALFGRPAAAQAIPDPRDPVAEVRAAEVAFARTMADRDFNAFQRFIAEDAVFFGESGPLRDKPAIVAAWAGLFEGARAPFSWAPDTVVVLSSGGLALSTGPVLDPEGRPVGRFNSIWRREPSGDWRVVFDRGS